MPGPPLPLLLLLVASGAGAAPLGPAAGAGEVPAVEVSPFSVVLSLCSFLLLIAAIANCASCCKDPEIDFKEFEDNFDDEIDFTPPAEDTPSVQSPAEVFTLSVPNIALPAPPQFQPSAEGLKSQVARHSLNYIQEIGSGWFGKVLLGEIYTGISVARVIVKELKASARPREQDAFLKNGEPYYVLQHPNVLQCVGQCVEAIPYLLVFEFCDLGDLKAYLRGEHDPPRGPAQTLLLQRMACEIAAGLAALHKLHFLHSDLALRNCFLTSDLNVKVGDYGIGPSRYKEDYVETDDKRLFPLRWTAPELVTSFQDRLLTAEQTKYSNIWSLGVTLWELFEGAAQPYSGLSDADVLSRVIRQRDTRLPKPQLEQPYAERWFEVLQFCWLPPDKRPAAEDVHRLLTYLRLQSQRESEADFEQQWEALKPSGNGQDTASSAAFPILDPFARDRLGREMEEVLTVTETSQGLSFEYVWEAAKHDHFDEHGRGCPDEGLSYSSVFFPGESFESSLPGPGTSTRDAASSQDVPLRAPGVVPVFDAHNLSVGSDYYIQLEEKSGGHTELDYPPPLLTTDMDPPARGPDGAAPFVTLRDLDLEESSTDEDFFPASTDPKDADPPLGDAPAPESPFNSIFNDVDEPEGLPGHQKVLDLMDLNGLQVDVRPPALIPGPPGEKEKPPKLFDCEPACLSENLLWQDQSDPLNIQELSENFLFLQEKNLLKDLPSSQEQASNLQAELREAGFPDAVLMPLQTIGAEPGPAGSTTVSSLLQDDPTLPRPASSSGQAPPTSVEAKGTPRARPLEVPLQQPDAQAPCLPVGICEDQLPPDISPSPEASKGSQDWVLGLKPSPDDVTPPVAGEVSIGQQNSQPGPLSTELPTGALEQLPQQDAALEAGLTSALSSDSASQDSLLDDSLSVPGLTSAPTSTSEQSADTPDSLDSVDDHDAPLGSHMPRKLQAPDKPADSGYETENLESPEWTLHPTPDVPSASDATPVVIVISDNVDGLRGPPGTSQTSYRDSAYFSDNDSEPEKKPEAVPGALTLSESQTPEPTPGPVNTCPEPLRSPPSQNCESTWPPPSPPASVSPEAQPTGGEAGNPRALHLELSSGSSGDGDHELLDTRPCTLASTGTNTDELLALAASLRPDSQSVRVTDKPFASHSEGPKLKEPDMEGRFLGKLGVGGTLGLSEDGVDADEEDEDSDDSDEDLRAFALHSLSSESDDEPEPRVPVILSSDDGRPLRSLLKPEARPPPTCKDRKAVTFFDDVTVYLFDQETPTKELGHCSGEASQGSELSGTSASGPPYLGRCLNSESSTDEEGGGFEWDDDFSADSFLPRTSELLGSRPVLQASKYFSPPPPRSAEPSWPHPAPCSRFSISPADIASFSLTHLTDSDMEQGGSSEDGEKD